LATKKQDPQPLDQGKAFAAMLALMVADREDRLAVGHNGRGGEPRKTEVILADAGLTSSEIAPLVGKKLPAVKKTIQRGRSK
jgi:DNA-directed RNA polymerase specialized sigma24 family protein